MSARADRRALSARLRSPMVLSCIDDYLAARRYPLECRQARRSRTRADARARHDLRSRVDRSIRHCTAVDQIVGSRTRLAGGIRRLTAATLYLAFFMSSSPSSSACPAASTRRSPPGCLQQQGYDVQGLFMSNWDEDEDGYCTAAQDYQDARKRLRAARHSPAQGEFRGRVPRARVRVFPRGISRRAHAESRRAVQSRDQVRRLLRLRAAARRGVGRDRALRPGRASDAARRGCCKASIPARIRATSCTRCRSQALARTLFPIGALQKSDVRRMARELTLPVFDKKDSTGICFIGERPFAEFLAQYLPAQPGDIETIDGRKRSASIAASCTTRSASARACVSAGAATRPTSAWYVADKDLRRNVLVVVQGHDHPALLRSRADARRS